MSTTNTNAIQTAAAAQQPGKSSIQGLIKQMQGEITKALPSVITPERFTRITLSALSSNPKLSQCSGKSFLGAMMTAAQLGLEPNTPLGQAYLIPYMNKGRLECQFQLGYKGLIDLAYRSGQIKTIQAQVVHQNDLFEVEYGTENKLTFKPLLAGDRGPATAVWAMFQTKDGGYGFEIMSIADAMAHGKKFSKAFNNGPWQTNPEEMCKKTVLKRVLKYAPLSTEFIRAVTADETIKSELSDDMFEIADETVYEAEGYVVSDVPVPESDPATGEVIGA